MLFNQHYLIGFSHIKQFLQDVFDALFAILMDDPDRYGELISDAVVSTNRSNWKNKHVESFFHLVPLH